MLVPKTFKKRCIETTMTAGLQERKVRVGKKERKHKKTETGFKVTKHNIINKQA